MEVKDFAGHGNFSNCFGWDSGLSCSVSETEMSDAQFSDLADCVRGYADYFGASHDTLGIWEDIDFLGRVRGVVLYTLNEYGGSRTVRGHVMADNPQKTLHRFSDALFPDTPYVSPEWEQQEREVFYHSQEMFKKISNILCNR